MAINPVDPKGLPKTDDVYHQVAIATGSTRVHPAGQVAWDEQGDLVAPGDLAGQVLQVYRNVAKGLAAAGTTFHDVVRFTWYAANRERGMYDDFVAGVEQASREYDLPRPPLAPIGVDILFEERILIEAAVTAVIDRADPSDASDGA